MTVFDHLLQYFGGVALALIFMYGTRQYLVTLIAGFIAFCVFYLSFEVKDFDWTFSSIFPHVIDAAIIYGVSFVIVLIVYKLFPLKRPILQKNTQ